MQKFLQASLICISVQENFVQAVSENIPPLPSSALNWKEKKGFAGGQMAIFISHSSAIPLYLDVVMVTFKCLFGRYVYSMEHDDCNSDFVQVEA